MKLHILNGGKMYLDRSSLVAGCTSANARNTHPTAEWISIPVCSYLIEHPDGLVLYDTGCDPLGMERNWSAENKNASPFEAVENGSIAERLAQLGYTPDDVDFVVMSHLHVDHAGGLPLFRKAEILVNDGEFTQAAKLYALQETRPAYDRADLRAIFSAGLRFNLLENERKTYDLLDGVQVLNFGPGHTFGMLGLYVELPRSGNFLLVADAIYTADNAGPPIRLPGLVYDSLGYVATVKYAVEFARRHRATILYGHDTAQMEQLRQAPDAYYD
jgi:glyoxylase-like metal-dependent hydrolase (beta-lactamase superfamily II)